MTTSLFKLLKAIGLTIILGLSCFLIFLVIVVFVLNDDQKAHLATGIATTLTNSDITTKKLIFSYNDGRVTIKAEQLRWKNRKTAAKHTVEQAEVIFPLSSIITPPIGLSSVILSNPTIDLSQHKAFAVKKDDTKKSWFVAHLFNRCNITIQNGALSLPHGLNISDIKLRTAYKSKRSRQIKFTATGNWQNGLFPISLEGFVDSFLTPYGINLDLSIGPFPLQLFNINKKLQFDRGMATIKSHFSSNSAGDKLRIKNDINLSDVQFIVSNSVDKKKNQPTQIKREKKYSYDHLFSTVVVDYGEGLFTLQPSVLKSNHFDITISGKLDLKPNSPALAVNINSSTMQLATFKKLLPDPILSHWLTTRLFPLFANGQAVLNDLSIKGSFEEISHLGQPENRNCLSLDLILEKTDITLEAPDVIFSNSSGHIQLNAGKLLISDIEGTMGQTTVQHGLYQIDDLYDDEMTHRFGGNHITTIADLARLSSISFMPDRLHKDGLFLNDYTGLVQADILAYLKPPYKSVRFERLDATISNVVSQTQIQGHPLTFQKIKISRNDALQNSVTGAGKWGEIVFQLSGFFTDDATGTINIDSELDFASFCPAYKDDQSGEKSPEDKKCSTAKLTIQRHNDTFSMIWNITFPTPPKFSGPEFKQTSTNGNLIANMTTADWRKFNIDAVSISYDQFLLKASGQGDLDAMNLKLKIHDAKPTSQNNTQKELKKENLKRSLRADLAFDIDLNQFYKSHLVGTLQGHSITLPLPGIPSNAVNADFDFVFSGRRLDIKKFDFLLEKNLEGSPLHVKGFLEGDKELKGVLLVDGEYINTDDFFELPLKYDPHSQDTPASPLHPGKRGVLVSTKIDKVDMKGTIVSPFFLQGNVVDSRFYPSDMVAKMEGGRLGMITTSDKEKQDNLRFCFFLKDTELKTLSPFFPHSETREMKGQLTAGGFIHAKGNSFEKLQSRLKGDIAFHVKKATLKGDYVLVRLLELLSIENLFSKKAEYAEDGDLYIKSLGGTLSVDNSILTSSDIFVDTIAFDASGDLKIDLQTKKIDSHLAVSPFGAVDTIVSTIPIIGHILTGKDKSLVSYHFQISGPLDNPEISYIPLKDIPASLLGYGKRLLTPSTYFIFSKESKKGINFDTISQGLVTEIERNFEIDHNSLHNQLQ